MHRLASSTPWPGTAQPTAAPAAAEPAPRDWGIRSARERIIQVLWFECAGLAIITPLYSRVTGSAISESLAMLALLSVVVMAWSVAFNTVFDVVEFRRVRRVANDRPHGLRVFHALAHETTVVVVSFPVIFALSDEGWSYALLADFSLTLTYAAYGYLFHLVFDHLRPLHVLLNETNVELAVPSPVPPGSSRTAAVRPRQISAATSIRLPSPGHTSSEGNTPRLRSRRQIMWLGLRRNSRTGTGTGCTHVPQCDDTLAAAVGGSRAVVPAPG